MSSKTFHGQTFGGLLTTAKVCTMQAGNVEVIVTDRKGNEYHAMIGGRRNGWGEVIHDVVRLYDFDGTHAVLSASPSALRKMRALESKAGEMMAATA